MKALLTNKLVIGILAVAVVAGGGFFAYQAISNNSGNNNSGNNNSNNSNNNSNTNSNGDFIKTGQYSFGLDVCNEFTKEMAGVAIDKTIVKTEDYSNSMSVGCNYYTDKVDFVVVDVGYGQAEKQKKGLEILDRTIVSEPSIGLENFISISDKAPGEYLDIYMVVDPEIKFVRIGRSSAKLVSNELLVKLAKSVEEKIRSYR
ncbi:hypothetical protein A2X44_03805 [candidate division CPR3 bacterium GWF2_35_18]|uniref:DUF3558 domain-containing protein n=1 Tax=candidate division CPR3 bacterium GW2011_GWF2_35_18 TaxID=1618350 RepID=A0A0G0BJQ4_UNCC3|nr:MAG: hypothetical protein UR67_C0004G0050 [candidate division CPR3 bacterium GW2011_GWF2_35_18]OGB63136.1 MAG: hypothetical protein A2X44_03805 [candidate division CPR3 bacterium GWF2_35_18]OGB64050.1 MAG: hypothetical protein A2250_04585 [candidate division CPR3 bacterium RIFOXYA2_FULL_35_13]OGB76043.1 MAG: hypothetical protein A2476_04425 [candidate division CPR3 bacterium RIFOXYC2_FULL_35_7]